MRDGVQSLIRVPADDVGIDLKLDSRQLAAFDALEQRLEFLAGFQFGLREDLRAPRLLLSGRLGLRRGDRPAERGGRRQKDQEASAAGR